MKDQFVTYEIAEKLSQLGFNEPCLMYFRLPGGGCAGREPVLVERLDVNNTLLKATLNNSWTTIPLWQQAIDWLRTKHSLHLKIDYCLNVDFFYTAHANKINPNFSTTYKHDVISRKNIGRHKTYEQAREAIITKALELIHNELGLKK